MKPKSLKEPVNILIVEDSPTQAEQLRYIVERDGYHGTIARNGKDALELLLKDRPTLIISDVVMPEMDGYQLCQRVKTDETLKDIPFVLLTSLSDPTDIVKGLMCGADNFITKPYDEAQLRSHIDYLLSNRHLYEREGTQMGIDVFFAGGKHSISAGRLQILNLLLSTYETAVHKNIELAWARDKLKLLSDNLEGLVQERTAALQEEISERKKAQEEQMKLAKKVELLLESTGEGIYGVDLEGRATLVNKAAAMTLGYNPEELLGKNMHELIHHSRSDGSPCPVAECRTDRAFQVGQPSRVDSEVFWRRDGTAIPVEYSSYPTIEDGATKGAVVVFRDITDRKKLEEQLRQSQKMEAVGQLAGGVAHDFNNLLTGIRGYADLALSPLDKGSPEAQDIAQIGELVDRAAGLTRQLLAFSRRQTLQPAVLNINTLVENTSKMLKRLIGEDIALEPFLAADLGNVRADPGQIEQVLMNLVINARDAMPLGGNLTIETSNAILDQEYANKHKGTEPGAYVMLAVTDTGCGMDEATQERIFEPFFTTKELGKGTGLGLSTVYGIVKQHEGSIWVYSEPGNGTSFKIYLPRVDAAIQEIAAKGEKAESAGSETIMVVEDEEVLREIARRTLENRGYKILLATRSEEAEELFAQHREEIDLLLIDVILPGTTGPELCDRLVKKRPSLKVLFMSGYTDRALACQKSLGEGASFLQKPFSTADLVKRVREVLDSEERAVAEIKSKILVADDEPSIVETLRRFLEKKNYQVVTASDGIEALEKVKHEKPDVVLLDIEMPGKSGLEVLKELKKHHPDIGVIMVTGVKDEAVGTNALSMGAFDYIVKPFDADYLEKALSWKLKLMD